MSNYELRKWVEDLHGAFRPINWKTWKEADEAHGEYTPEEIVTLLNVVTGDIARCIRSGDIYGAVTELCNLILSAHRWAGKILPSGSLELHIMEAISRQTLFAESMLRRLNESRQKNPEEN